jgi:hypothetical protein
LAVNKYFKGEQMTNEEVMALMFDMGIHDSLEKENWIPDNAWVLFANRVAAHEREKVAQWMMERGYATGHGDTIQALVEELEAQLEQEPVAWLYRDAWEVMKLSQTTPPPVGAFPVYSTPQQRPWVGLTMLDMAELRQGGFHTITDEHFRAIEAALKDKNG